VPIDGRWGDVRYRTDDHFRRRDELAREVSMGHNYRAHQFGWIVTFRVCFDDFHFFFAAARDPDALALVALTFRRSRCTARASKPACRSFEVISFAIITER